MILRIILVSCCLILATLCVTGKSSLAQIASTANLRAQHRATLESWLQGKPRLRLAIEKDCLNVEGLAASRAEYGRDYQPYYAVGDFNRDGQQDFAVIIEIYFAVLWLPYRQSASQVLRVPVSLRCRSTTGICHD